jgi:hypothetical protein
MLTPYRFCDDLLGRIGPDEPHGVFIPAIEVVVDVPHQGAHGVKGPRRMLFRVSTLNQTSIMFSHDAPIGVK